MAEMSSLGTESFNAPAIVPFKSMTPVMASPGVSDMGSMENTGGEGLSIMESMKESLGGMVGPMAAITGILVIIKEGISKLVEFARETLNFEKKQNDSLENYYHVNFSLMQHHNYSLSDIENMLPWERDIYVDMLITYIKEENDKIKRRKQGTGK